jgi:hypothetical protein
MYDQECHAVKIKIQRLQEVSTEGVYEKYIEAQLQVRCNPVCCRSLKYRIYAMVFIQNFTVVYEAAQMHGQQIYENQRRISVLKKRSYLSVLMAVSLLLTLFSPINTAAASGKETGKESPMQSYVSAMQPGWNLGNTFDAFNPNDPTGGDETAWGSPRITKEFIKEIKKQGFKSIRIPITWDKRMGGTRLYNQSGLDEPGSASCRLVAQRGSVCHDQRSPRRLEVAQNDADES